MVEIRIAYEGQLRCSAVHGPSQRQLLTDAPTDNQGQGESFSPTDLVATALGSCALTIMGIVAERQGWQLGGLNMTVQKHMRADPVRRIGKLVVQVRGGAGLDAEQRATLKEAALGCPVNASLGDGIEVEFCFNWGT